MGFLDKFSASITKLKTTSHDPSIAPAPVADSGAITVATGTSSPYDTDYDPSDKNNAGAVTVGTLGTLSEGNDSETQHSSGYKSHIFEDPEIASYYADLYEKSQYEGRAYFDPNFEWSKEEETVVRRKSDWRVVGWAFIMFFALDVDRFNLQNAIAGSLFEDVKIDQNDYNLGSTVNLICFLAAEVPSQLISKKLGPDVWIPIQMVLWSLVATFQCFIKNKSGFLATRALLGLLEGGFIPDVCLWMSYFFTASELAVRMGYFYLANPFTQAVSGLMAYGIQHLDGHADWSGWRWIFMIEGLLTLSIGIASFFLMPPSVVQTRARWRPNGWFTPREEKIMVNRILRDDPSKGDMHNREAITLKAIWKSIMDFHMWPIYWSRLLLDIATSSIGRYLAIILKSMGFSTLNTDLLMIPPNVCAMITSMANVYFCQFTGLHTLSMAIIGVWIIPCLAALRYWDGFLKNKWGSYALLVVTLSYPPTPPITSSWVSANANSVRTRTIAAALNNVHGQLGGIIASNMLRKDDAPLYHRANQQLLAIAIAAVVLVAGVNLLYTWINRQRKAKWDRMNKGEQVEYLVANRTMGNKRIDFQLAK